MTDAQNRSGNERGREGLLDAQARLSSIRGTVDQMRDAGIDESLITALRAAVDAMQWLGNFRFFNSDTDSDFRIPDAWSVEQWESYSALSIKLNELVVRLVSNAPASDVLEEEVGDNLEQVIEFIREFAMSVDLEETIGHGGALRVNDALEERFVAASSTLNSYRLWLRTKGGGGERREDCRRPRRIGGRGVGNQALDRV